MKHELFRGLCIQGNPAKINQLAKQVVLIDQSHFLWYKTPALLRQRIHFDNKEKTMCKRLERLRDSGWLLVVSCLLTAWFLLLPCRGFQLVRSTVASLHAEHSEQQKHPYTREKAYELRQIGQSMWDKAQALGPAYGPKNYFADRRTIDENERFGWTLESYPGELLHNLVQRNLDAKRFSRADLTAESDAYKDYRKFLPRYQAEDKKWRDNGGWREVRQYLLSLYAWGLLYFPLLFFIRMIQNGDGIKETIQADKRRFILAVLFWPGHITSYPNNVAHELIVEATLRARERNLFQRGSRRQREEARRIVRSGNYRNWMRLNLPLLRHSLAFAVLITLACYLLPARSEAKAMRTPTHAGISTHLRDGPARTLVHAAPHAQQYFSPCLLTASVRVPIPADEEVPPKRHGWPYSWPPRPPYLKEIGHVPLLAVA
jgi:hypothetical protein